MTSGARLVGLSLAWLFGVFLHLQCRTLWPGWAHALVLTGGLLVCLCANRRRRAWPFLLAGAVAVGAGASGWRASERLDDRLPHSLEGENLLVTGVVAGLPQMGPSGLRFRFEVATALRQGEPVEVPRVLALGWYAPAFSAEVPTLSAQQRQLRAGQAWRFTVRLRRPHGNVNPHGFDYELYLFEQGVRATGSVRNEQAVMLDPEAAHPIDRWRQKVRDAILATVEDRRAAGVLAALAVGDQSAIDHEDWQIFRNTGVSHLMSISGLHVTMFAWLFGAGVMALWRRGNLALWLPAQQAARWGGLGAAFGYALLAGWGVPSQRTVWMLGTAAVLQSLGRRWPWPLVLLTAAVIVSALDPWALLQAGFWLSFTAVGLLMASEPSHGPPPDRIRPSGWRRGWASLQGVVMGGLRTQVVATVGLAPLTLLCFQQVSVLGLVANLVAIPLVTLAVTPLALLGVAWHELWMLGAFVVRHFTSALQWIDGWPGAVWSAPVAPLWAQAAGLLAAVVAVMPLPWRLRLLAVPLMFPLLMPARSLPEVGQFELLAADVGQGTAVLIRTRGHLLLFDTGPQYSQETDAGQRVLLPLLRALGETRIDRLVLSHRDIDHVGGAAALLKSLPVTDLLSSLETEHPLRSLTASDVRCHEGQNWEWDGVRFEVLHPRVTDHERRVKPNALSCVLRVSGPHGSALLTGDIEKAQESRLVSAGAPLQSDILIVPHHGSRTSSTAAFLDAVRPKVAIIQAGYRNRFGHPVAEVLARLTARQVAVRDSAACGAWRWRGREAVDEGTCQRQIDLRYWHDARE